MFGKKETENEGPIRDLQSKLLRNFFSHKSTNADETSFIVGFAMTQLRECAFDEYEYKLFNHVEGISVNSGWLPTGRQREIECLGVVARSTADEYFPASIALSESAVPQQRPEGKQKPALGYVSISKIESGGFYCCRSALWGSRGDLSARVRAAFESASLSNRPYVELRCEVRTPSIDEFYRDLLDKEYSARLDVIQV